MATLGLLLMAPPALADVGGEDEGAGNNLAMPVIWAEDEIGPVLRGEGPQTAELPNVVKADSYTVIGELKDAQLILDPENATYVEEGGQSLFLQKIENNEWQAENRTLTDTGLADATTDKLNVTYVDWGDNLEVKDWSTKQKIRVEARLLQDVSALADADVAGTETDGFGMTGYAMAKLANTPKGPGEMWGVVATGSGSNWLATESQVDEAFVYTGEACLTIEGPMEEAKTYDWNGTNWTGSHVLHTCLGDGEGGLNQFASEVTISGGMTYGSVWDPSGLDDGDYRMTFSLQAGSGVDIVEGTALYASDEEGGDDHADESVTALAEEDAAGGAPEGNQAVIVHEDNLSYIDVGLGSRTHGKPTRPVNLTAEPGEMSMELAWDPPLYEGSSPVSHYIVTAEGIGSAQVLAPLTTKLFTGLPGGVARTFTVVAVNDEGPGDAASIEATPKTPTSPTEPPTTPPTTPPTEPPTVTPPTDVGKTVTVRVRAVSGGKKLYVNVGPNKGRGYYQFTVQKLSKGKWRTLSKVYKTYRKGETRRLRLSKGTYRVIVLPRYGYQGATSEVISLRTETPTVLPLETEQAVTLAARSKSSKRKLYVNVNPNMGKGYFQFVVQRKTNGKWRALKKVYKTKTRVEKRTLNLRRGSYRVIVMPRYGFQGAQSDPVWLRR